MSILKKIRSHIIRYIPKRRHLHGSMLHRAIGEKLFDADIWKFTRRNVAGGLAVGLFIAMTPTIGLQMLIAGTFAYLLRVNIPIALIACWITNPLTATIIYPLQYKLGCWLMENIWRQGLVEKTGLLQNFYQHAKPLWFGSLFVGIISAVIGYVFIISAWSWMQKFYVESSHENSNDEKENNSEKSSTKREESCSK